MAEVTGPIRIRDRAPGSVSERPLSDYVAVAAVSERTDVRVGVPLPLGTTAHDAGVNFALFSRNASRIRRALFARPADATPAKVVDFDPACNRGCIEVSAHALARYAALCQEAELVPIVELEVLMDGEHTLAQCREATEEVLQTVFHLIEKLRALDGNVALFSHGHFGCVLAARWIGSPLVEAQYFTLGTASLGILGRDTATPRCRSSLCGMRLHAQT